MSALLNNWDEAPLLRASSNVIETPVSIERESPCMAAPFSPRLNIGNIHEIKKIWTLPTKTDQ